MRWNILLQGKNVELAYRVGQLFPWLSVFVSKDLRMMEAPPISGFSFRQPMSHVNIWT